MVQDKLIASLTHRPELRFITLLGLNHEILRSELPQALDHGSKKERKRVTVAVHMETTWTWSHDSEDSTCKFIFVIVSGMVWLIQEISSYYLLYGGLFFALHAILCATFIKQLSGVLGLHFLDPDGVLMLIFPSCRISSRRESVWDYVVALRPNYPEFQLNDTFHYNSDTKSPYVAMTIG